MLHKPVCAPAFSLCLRIQPETLAACGLPDIGPCSTSAERISELFNQQLLATAYDQALIQPLLQQTNEAKQTDLIAF